MFTENTGCYVLPFLKDFVPEIFKLGRTYPTIHHPSTQKIIHEQSLSLKDSKCCMIICERCVYMYLSNAKIRRLLIQ